MLNFSAFFQQHSSNASSELYIFILFGFMLLLCYLCLQSLVLLS
jgi:hypothetical protein